MTETKEPDLIDRIANALPHEVRADYYREMRHCRSLPENDEMLRVIRAMSFLTLLMEQVPLRMVKEREQLDNRYTEIIFIVEKFEILTIQYYRDFDKRLSELPGNIANDINPKAIVDKINDTLRKHFDQSTIPIIAKELADTAAAMKATTAEYQRATKDVDNSWRSAVAAADRSIECIKSSISQASASAKQANADLSISFQKSYRWFLRGVCVTGFMAGFMVSVLIYEYIRPYRKIVYEVPQEVQQMLKMQEKEKADTQEASPQKGK